MCLWEVVLLTGWWKQCIPRAVLHCGSVGHLRSIAQFPVVEHWAWHLFEQLTRDSYLYIIRYMVLLVLPLVGSYSDEHMINYGEWVKIQGLFTWSTFSEVGHFWWGRCKLSHFGIPKDSTHTVAVNLRVETLKRGETILFCIVEAPCFIRWPIFNSK